MKWHKLIRVMIVGMGLLGSVMVLPLTAQPRGEVPGSILIFPEFNISPLAVIQLRISDVQNPALGGTTRVHLNDICPPAGGPAGVCAEVDGHKAITLHGTALLDVATELGGSGGAPRQKGYVIVFAEDAQHHAIAANQLIGSYRISGRDGDDAEAAQAIAMQSPQLPRTQLGAIDAMGELVLSFGILATNDYVSLPWILYNDFQAVDVAAGTMTELIVLTPSIKSGLPNTTAQIGIHGWNQFEDKFSSTKSFTCEDRRSLGLINNVFREVSTSETTICHILHTWSTSATFGSGSMPHTLEAEDLGGVSWASYSPPRTIKIERLQWKIPNFSVAVSLSQNFVIYPKAYFEASSNLAKDCCLPAGCSFTHLSQMTRKEGVHA